jgi:hypothetical protein
LREESYTFSLKLHKWQHMSKSPPKRSTSSKGEMRLSIRFGQREDGMMFMEYTEENAEDMEREAR